MKKINKDKLKFKIKKLEKNDTFYTCDGYLNHIVDVIFDDNEQQYIVVYKCYIPHKKYWKYYAKELLLLIYEIKYLYNLSHEQTEQLFQINNIKPLNHD